MAQFKPYRITQAQLNSLAIKEGQFICTTDTGRMYLDVTNTERISLSETKVIPSRTEPVGEIAGDLWLVLSE